jgi:hypothetical protein
VSVTDLIPISLIVLVIYLLKTGVLAGLLLGIKSFGSDSGKSSAIRESGMTLSCRFFFIPLAVCLSKAD